MVRGGGLDLKDHLGISHALSEASRDGNLNRSEWIHSAILQLAESEVPLPLWTMMK